MWCVGAVVLVLTFAAPVVSIDCTLPKNAGSACSDGQPAYSFYYDQRFKVCQPMQFKGCGGNENRFPSRDACLAACKNGGTGSGASTNSSRPTPPPGSQWVLADKCGANYLIPNGEYAKCQQPDNSCPAEHNCNGDVCCPTKAYVCSLRDETGDFADGIEDKPRFAWSDAIHSCVRFSYYGANGNYNNFPNFYSCINYCSNK